ncbi:DUF11 domain-containing protein [bacterium]|nr:DUF11 domain-containing protein [bacterium]
MRRFLALISLMGGVVFGQVPIGTEITNVAQSSHQDASETTFVGSSNTIITVVSGGYQLGITKTASASFVAPGESLTYTITVSNMGNIPSTPFTITDTVSTGFEIISSSPNADISGQIVSWNVAGIAAGQILVYELEVMVNSDLPVDEAITNIAWLAAEDGFELASNPVEVSIGALADLMITKMVAEDVSSIGDTVHYTINVYNIGNIPSTGTHVTDILPDHVIFANASHGGQLDKDEVKWALGDLAEGDSLSLSLELIVAEGMPPNSDLVNYVMAENSQGDSDETTVTSIANPWIQSIEKWAEDLEYGFGDTVAFVITIDNQSPDPVHAISVRDTLPEPLQFVAASSGAVFEDGVIVWNLGSLNSGNSITLNVVTTVSSLLEARPQITNRAHISTANAGSSYGDQVVSLAAFPELVLEKIAFAHIFAGDSLRYTFVMSNIGNSMAHDVVLRDTLSAHLNYGSTISDYVYDEASHSVLWNVGELASGATDTLELITYVDYPIINGTIVENTAYLSCVEGSMVGSTVLTQVRSAPGLFLDISGNNVVMAGDTIHYQLDYRNQGTETATAVVLRDTLANEVEYLDASPAHSYNPDTRIITWSLEDLAPEDSGTVYVTARVSDEINYSIQVRNGGFLVCEQGAECVGAHVSTVRAPMLDIDLVGDTIYVQAGEFISYELAFANVGDTTATNVVVVDSLPEEVTFINATNGGIYDSTSHSVVWNVGDLEPEGSSEGVAGKYTHPAANTRNEVNDAVDPESTYIIDVQVNYPLPNGLELANTAYIYSDENLQTQATWLATVFSSPEFLFTKTAELEVFPGDTIHYQLDFANYGTDHASGVSIQDTLDSRVLFLDASGDYIYDLANHSLSWYVGALNVGDVHNFQITAIVDGMLEDGAQVGNRAWLVSNEVEAIPAVVTTTNILPLSVVLDAQPRSILGNGASTSTLAAHVYSYLGNPVPDGINVNFYTDAGTIPDTVFTTATVDGIAFSTLVSDTVVFEAVVATPYARAVYSETDYADDTTQVIFMIGAFDGSIYSYEGIPQENVRVELRCADNGEIAGHDSTNAEGYYLIPIYQDDLYLIVYTLINEFGEEYETTQEIEIETPSEGSLVTNLNSVSGWLYDDITGQPIGEDSILVIVIGDPDTTSGLGKTANHVSDSTYTDSTGQFFFTNLLPGTYSLRVLYKGVSSYSDGELDVNLTQPGLYIVGANVTLRAAPFYVYKTVDKREAAAGDTLHYIVNFGTQADVAFPDSVFIYDYLPPGLEFISGSDLTDANTSFDGVDPITKQLKFSRHEISINDSLKIEFDARISNETEPGWIENRVLVTSIIDSTWSDGNLQSNARTKIIRPFLEVTKVSNRRVIEIGDVITYTVQLTNKSVDDFIRDFVIEDLLPYGFKYRPNTSYWNGSKLFDPDIVVDTTQSRLAMSWTISDTLSPGETFEMKYRIIAGLTAKEGTNTNEVLAYGQTLLGFPVTSNLATADVILKPGLFSDRGLIIGKVYYDLNQNHIHDENEKTVKNVELIMENGARILTDEYGKYSVPDVTAGMHVIRVNEYTLPHLSEIILDSPDYLGDTQSKMVRVAAAGIAKTNFALREIATPGTLTGSVYYDMNRNGVHDFDEDVQANAVLILNNSTLVMTDSLGKFIFNETALGDLILSVDESSLPSYGTLFKSDSTVDSTGQSQNLWTTTMFSGDTLNIDVPLEKLELFSVLSKESTLEMRTEMLTEEFRLLVYKPWNLIIRVGFVSGSATLQSEIFTELKNIGDLMKWQTQINLDINGHTDNIPVSPGSGFRDNQELSESRAMSIRNYLIQTMGISPDRIHAFGHGDTLAIADNNTSEGRAINRRVEMVFFNASTDDSEFNQLEFMYDIKYTGEIPISDIRFHQELPPGFIYKSGTAKLDAVVLEPIAHEDESDTWTFGNWTSEKHSEFDVAMKPDDYEKVQNTGVVSAYLEMIDIDGNMIVTDSLETRISTLVETLSFNMVLEGTQFDVGSADLKPSAYPSLHKLGKFLAWQKDIEIVIEGFTDNRGSLEFNMLLSDWRATSVKNFLLENYNVNPQFVHTHGLGPHYPIGDNEEWLGRASNRRVEVLVNAEVGEAALLELDVIKESLKRTIEIPVDPLETMLPDSALSIPANQASTLLLNMSFPAYPGADSMAITLALPNDMEYVDVAGSLKSWGHTIEAGEIEATPAVHISSPEGVYGVHELYLSVQIFQNDMPLSSNIEKVLKVNIEDPTQISVYEPIPESVEKTVELNIEESTPVPVDEPEQFKPEDSEVINE